MLSCSDIVCDEKEALDPRIQVELEKLNKASDAINRLEIELDEARSKFRQVLSESTQQLEVLAKDIGKAVEKSKLYYDARIAAKEAQEKTQAAALRYERAISMQNAAKEMVELAEMEYVKKGEPCETAWQEMLNHAVMKVNDAEKERLESEVEHQVKSHVYRQTEGEVRQLHKDQRRNIAKSRPYYESKARFHRLLDEHKSTVNTLEEDVALAKMLYSESLRMLEEISDEIHLKRKMNQDELDLGERTEGVGSESPEPAPHETNKEMTDGSDISPRDSLHTEEGAQSQPECSLQSNSPKVVLRKKDKRKMSAKLPLVDGLQNFALQESDRSSTNQSKQLPKQHSVAETIETETFDALFISKSRTNSVASSIPDDQLDKLNIDISQLELEIESRYEIQKTNLREFEKRMTLPPRLTYLERHLSSPRLRKIPSEELLLTQNGNCDIRKNKTVSSYM